MKNFTMTKTGVLIITKPSENQCRKRNHRKFNYTCVIQCCNKLDKNGFIIDNTEIHNTIIAKPNTGSCEQVAFSLVRRVAEKLVNHGAKVKYVTISLVPVMKNPTTKLTYHEDF